MLGQKARKPQDLVTFAPSIAPSDNCCPSSTDVIDSQKQVVYTTYEVEQPTLTPAQAERAAKFLAMALCKGKTPQREAQARIKAKQVEMREARREARPQPQKPTGAVVADKWLADECVELLAMAEQGDVAEHPGWQMPRNLEDAQRSLHAAQSARVHIRAMADRLTTERPSADAVAGERLAGLIPTRGRGARTEGPIRLWRLLHRVATYLAVRGKRHHSTAQIVLHSAAELLAVALRVDERTVRRWTDELEGAGVIQARAHYTNDVDADTGEVITRIDGTLYAVALQPGHTAHLSYSDLHHRYRDLTADRHAGRTAYRYAKKINALWDAKNKMSGSMYNPEGGEAEPEQTAVRVLMSWAVTPGGGAELLEHRYSVDPDIFCETEKMPMQTVIYDLPLIADEGDPDRRRMLVHHAASSIAAALADDHSVALWAGRIWHALKRGWHGLQGLAAQLARFEAGHREGEAQRHRAALLNHRT